MGMGHRFRLEKYSGARSRHTCLVCESSKVFVRYVDEQTGHYLASHVGRCNREAKCGYHYTPRQFFSDNPSVKAERLSTRSVNHGAKKMRITSATKVDLLSVEILKRTLGAYERNNFLKFLSSRFVLDEVSLVVRRYLIGTWSDNRTVFWQIDNCGRVRTGKLIAYSAVTGKREKGRAPSWVHAELKRTGALSTNFTLQQCFFGEHLLRRELTQVIGLVESEKTAIVASLFMPDYLWVATGGCGNLDLTRLWRAMRGRRVILFPDSSKFKSWSAKADEARRAFDLDVRVSDLLERRLTAGQKREDYDIADFLLAGKQKGKV
jgi:hypothetical protein